jgi:CRP-like cAMP-binding protein
MRSLDLPSGSILVAPGQPPSNVYVVKKGLAGIFDRLERLMAFVYKEESFGVEALFEMTSFMFVKALVPTEVEAYEPDEYRDILKGGARIELLKSLARKVRDVDKRYPLSSDDRIRDILKELLSNGWPKNELSSIVVNLSVSDALAFERVRGEYAI